MQPVVVSAGPIEAAPLPPSLTGDEKSRLLTEVLSSAGVNLGSHDRVIVEWLAIWDMAIIVNIASLIKRAGA